MSRPLGGDWADNVVTLTGMELMTLKEEVGRRIRILRTARKLSQQELAEMIGMRTETISRFELGKQEFSTERLEQLAKALRVDVRDFFPSKSEAGKPPAVTGEPDVRAVLGIWVAHMQVSLAEVSDGVELLRDAADTLGDILTSVRDHITIMEERFQVDESAQIPEIDQLKEMFVALRQRRTNRQTQRDAERIAAAQRIVDRLEAKERERNQAAS